MQIMRDHAGGVQTSLDCRNTCRMTHGSARDEKVIDEVDASGRGAGPLVEGKERRGGGDNPDDDRQKRVCIQAKGC